MTLKPLHDPSSGILRAVALMSGSGTNLCRILEHEQRLTRERGSSPFHVCAVFSDTITGKAVEIGRDYNLPVLIRDIAAFYRAHNCPRRDMQLRAAYDRETVRLLAPLEARVAIYAGYMSIATAVLIDAFLGINVHPSDLALELNGQRKWVGAHAIRDAICGGEAELRSTTHIVEPVVDGGRRLMISPPLKVSLPPGFDPDDKQRLASLEAEYQERLKQAGDWVIMPRTLEYIADGRYAADPDGHLFFDGAPLPKGLRLE